MDVATVVTVAASATAVIGAVAAGARVLRKVSRQMDQMQRDWYGEAARPGYDRRPGVPERLKSIEDQLKPNGGSSTRDAINRMELGMNRLSIDQGILQRQLDEHLQIARYGGSPVSELPPGYVQGERS